MCALEQVSAYSKPAYAIGFPWSSGAFFEDAIKPWPEFDDFIGRAPKLPWIVFDSTTEKNGLSFVPCAGAIRRAIGQGCKSMIGYFLQQ